MNTFTKDKQTLECLLRRTDAARDATENLWPPVLPQNLGKDCLRKLGGAAVPARGTLSPLPGLGTGRLGTEEDRPSGQIDV